MPRLRSRMRPLAKCAHEPCEVTFRPWAGRIYCSDRCKKNAWRATHREYYIQLRLAWRARKKQERRQSRKFAWVEEGKEDLTPDRLTIAEALAQASPEVIKEIKALLPKDTV